MSDSLTVRDYLTFLAPNLFTANAAFDCPIWPGDVFALCASLLYRSEAVRGIGIEYLREKQDVRRERIRRTTKRARKWRRKAGAGNPYKYAATLWQSWISEGLDLEVSELCKHGAVCEKLIELCTLADETFAGVGIVQDTFDSTASSDADLSKKQYSELDFWRIAFNLLTDIAGDPDSPSLGATLCREISRKRVRTLPKAQPSTKGLSIRSLTSYISLCPGIDVPIKWHGALRSQVATDRKCNLLLVPWPLAVKPNQFHDVGLDHLHDRVGWFGYTPDPWGEGPEKTVRRLLAAARSDVGNVDIVVLPETALTESQYSKLAALLAEEGVTLISGVTSAHSDFDGLSKNYASISFPTSIGKDRPRPINQHKHHRWKLDSSQIESYRLATQLDPQRSWWEAISLTDRSLNFFVLRDWLCSCVLICEDLARLDPAGQIVRAVAPDLVIALLFDGPQLPTRWPAYHATVLADDPGCSVLTLSNLGMTKLSKPRSVGNADSCSGVIGMWRDPRKGHVEIRLPPDKEGALLTITRCSATSETADGRTNSRVEGSPEFAGLYFL